MFYASYHVPGTQDDSSSPHVTAAAQQRALYSRSRDGLKRMSFSVLWRNIEKKRRVSPVKNSSYNTALDLSGKTPRWMKNNGGVVKAQ